MSDFDQAHIELQREQYYDDVSERVARESDFDEDHDKEDYILVAMIRDTNTEVLAASLISALDRDKVSILINRLTKHLEL